MTNIYKDLKLIGKATHTIDGLKQKCGELEAKLNELGQTLVQTQLDLNATKNIRQVTEQKLTELEVNYRSLEALQMDVLEENNLLLKQLHQAQEKLEHKFLQYQNENNTHKSTQKQLDRVLADNPSYYSYDSIDSQPIISDPERRHWRIKGFLAAGRYWNQFEFDTFLENGIAGFEFKKKTSPLLVWPQYVAEDAKAVFIPTGTIESATQRAKILESMSTADWQLITILPRVLFESIKKNSEITFESNQLKDALQKLLEILLNYIPKKLRYDNVELIKILERPGYEHLHFKITNLIYGNHLHPSFEFRLGCANVTSSVFGSDPKLEFPKQTGKPQLISWFAESEDEFGEKLELRFAMPNIMDLMIWNAIEKSDQKLISELIKTIPMMFENIRYDTKQLNRPLKIWANLAKEMHRILMENENIK